MKTKETLLRIGIYVVGVICLYAFISIRYLPALNLTLKEKYIPEHWEFTRWGELYYFNYIEHFKEDNLPAPIRKYRLSDRNTSIDDSEIIIFGDSFFDISRQVTLPERLKDSLDVNVFFAWEDSPFKYFAENKYQNNDPKLFIYETVERYLPNRFFSKHDYFPAVVNKDSKFSVARDMRDMIFHENSEELYTRMLRGSIFTNGIYSKIATFKFDWFGQISTLTSKYYLPEDDIPWLFISDQYEVSNKGFYYQFSQEEIDCYCDNIKDMADGIKKHFNMDFLFITVPNKYTLYHDIINNDPYNNFLPMIYEGLEKRNIKYIRLLDDFHQSDTLLYYRTDTHWNSKGVDIALKKTINIIRNEFPYVVQ